MEIASTSRALRLFPAEQRFKFNGVGCKRTDFSEISSQNCRNRKKEEEDRFGIMPVSKKRNKICQEEGDAPNKRQKKTVIIVQNSTSKAKSVTTSLGVTTSRSKFTKPLPRIRLHQEIKTKQVEEETKNQGHCSLRDLVEKAKHKVEEKRKIDARREYIARLRLEARFAINRIEQTVVVADDHLKYHRDLENLGCAFIHEQVSLLTKFSLREH